MKLPVCTLPVLLVGLCVPVAAAQGDWQMSEQRRNELRDAIEAHRASQREEVRREETQAGRRLTPAELAQLREQVRQQWAPRGNAVHAGEAVGPARVAPVAAPRPVPRMQRP